MQLSSHISKLTVSNSCLLIEVKNLELDNTKLRQSIEEIRIQNEVMLSEKENEIINATISKVEVMQEELKAYIDQVLGEKILLSDDLNPNSSAIDVLTKESVALRQEHMRLLEINERANNEVSSLNTQLGLKQVELRTLMSENQKLLKESHWAQVLVELRALGSEPKMSELEASEILALIPGFAQIMNES